MLIRITLALEIKGLDKMKIHWIRNIINVYPRTVARNGNYDRKCTNLSINILFYTSINVPNTPLYSIDRLFIISFTSVLINYY